MCHRRCHSQRLWSHNDTGIAFPVFLDGFQPVTLDNKDIQVFDTSYGTRCDYPLGISVTICYSLRTI